MVDLEQLSEDIRNEMVELEAIKENLQNLEVKTKAQPELKNITNQIGHISNNLETYSDLVYREFEEDFFRQCEKLEDENKLLRKILEDILSYQDKIDIRIKYGIEID